MTFIKYSHVRGLANLWFGRGCVRSDCDGKMEYCGLWRARGISQYRQVYHCFKCGSQINRKGSGVEVWREPGLWPPVSPMDVYDKPFKSSKPTRERDGKRRARAAKTLLALEQAKSGARRK